MTLDDGREAIDQMGVGAPVTAESTENGCQGGSAEANERRCGTCSKTGHNTRTCQIVVTMYGEEYRN
ncbi:hypothetical protein FOC4_g10001926 [Fusarium odoratissimum]|uniref:CCHC-type domain-containing protein n=1 Tax=Fusarium oxysporum f. sp. cubense (strain race 4) TaxID=2502994 RepID=N1SA66_FUSC4|nr:hypothetical protein FOC4_g10001926 [Fusarium odoratissimum]